MPEPPKHRLAVASISPLLVPVLAARPVTRLPATCPVAPEEQEVAEVVTGPALQARRDGKPLLQLRDEPQVERAEEDGWRREIDPCAQACSTEEAPTRPEKNMVGQA